SHAPRYQEASGRARSVLDVRGNPRPRDASAIVTYRCPDAKGSGILGRQDRAAIVRLPSLSCVVYETKRSANVAPVDEVAHPKRLIELSSIGELGKRVSLRRITIHDHCHLRTGAESDFAVILADVETGNPILATIEIRHIERCITLLVDAIDGDPFSIDLESGDDRVFVA